MLIFHIVISFRENQNADGWYETQEEPKR